MDKWQILHVTDFHIKDPLDTGEHLRIKHFDEYLNKLARRIRKRKIELDCLVITGDFVDRGIIANFEHANTVVSHLADRLTLPPNKVVVCNGNHDIVRDDEKAGRFLDARKNYIEFANKFANKDSVEKSDRGVLLKPGDDIWCLMLDTTIGSGGEDKPGDLKESEADDIMAWIKTHVRREELLIIGTHHPVHDLVAHMSVMDEENPRWAERHIWHDGGMLRERIHDMEEAPKTLWLCGDIHKNFNVIDNKQCFVTTGRLGTRTEKHDSQLRRQARIIVVPKTDEIPLSLLMEYELGGHFGQAQTGRWKFTTEKHARLITLDDEEEESSSLRTEFIPITPSTSQNQHSEEESASTEESGSAPEPDTKEQYPPNETGEGEASGGNARVIELIETDGANYSELQEALLRTIRDDELYKFGRFTTSDSEVSLAWVSIGPLLNAGQTLSLITRHMAAWLRKKLTVEQYDPIEKTVLLGIDCWGAVLASQISVLTGARNFCIAARARGQHSVEAERVNDQVLNYIKECDTIVLVSDVVASGQSLKYLYDSVCGQRGDESKRLRWLALSIICDSTQVRDKGIEFLDAHGTACKDLRMPVLSSDALPDESILPSIISFRSY